MSPPESLEKRLLRISGFALILAPAIWHLRAFFTIVVARRTFPLELEWMESGQLYHVHRLLHRLPLYVDPSSGFVPHPYPPAYWWSVATLARLGGRLDFSTGRSLSIASVVLVMFLLGAIFFRSVASHFAATAFAVVSAGAIAAGYPSAGGSFDLARPDAFATALVIAAAALLADDKTDKRLLARSVLAGLTMAAALFAKQTNALFAGWLVVFAVARDRRSGLVFAGTTTAVALAGFGAIQSASGGWFSTWLFLHRHHPIVWSEAGVALLAFLRHAPVLLLVVPLTVFLWRRGALRPVSLKWFGMLGAAIVSATLAYAKVGGWVNVYTPVFFLSWPVFFLLAIDLGRHLDRPQSGWAALAVSAALLLTIRYGPGPFVPTRAMWAEAKRFDAIVAGLSGDVVIVASAFTPARAGTAATQPIFPAYVDAALAGMPVDLARAIDQSGARWLILTGTAEEESVAKQIGGTFVALRGLPDGPNSPGVRRGKPTLWARRAPGLLP